VHLGCAAGLGYLCAILFKCRIAADEIRAKTVMYLASTIIKAIQTCRRYRHWHCDWQWTSVQRETGLDRLMLHSDLRALALLKCGALLVLTFALQLGLQCWVLALLRPGVL
jgi:hypothetical protein